MQTGETRKFTQIGRPKTGVWRCHGNANLRRKAHERQKRRWEDDRYKTAYFSKEHETSFLTSWPHINFNKAKIAQSVQWLRWNIPKGTRELSLLQIVQTDSEPRIPPSLCLVTWCVRTTSLDTNAHPQYSIDCSSIEHLSEGTRNAPWGWQFNSETCRSYHT
jgi:hypothetical protein